jgi:SPP1 gp7 family putative phage head morphogenesis protein
MRQETLLQLIAQRKKKNIKRKAIIPPKWLYPKNAEKQYDKVLYSLTRQLKKLIKEYLIPAIPSMIEEVKNKTPHDSRNDDYLDQLTNIIYFINQAIKGKVIESIGASELIGRQIAAFNKVQFEKMTHSAFGIDIFVDEPWLQDQLKLFSSQNAQLITSIPEQELDRVSQDVERGLQQGLRFTDIAQTIQKSFGITHRRATLIARDQTQKLNASLTRLRQEEVGVEEYIWQTSNDERVRPTHRANEGKKFRWDTPPPITGHVGHDINCRCVARPVLDKLLNIG